MNTSSEDLANSSKSYDEKQFHETNIDSGETTEKQIAGDSEDETLFHQPKCVDQEVQCTRRETRSRPKTYGHKNEDRKRQSYKGGTEKAKYEDGDTVQFPEDCDETKEKQIVCNSHSLAEVSSVIGHSNRGNLKNKSRVDFEGRRTPLTYLSSWNSWRDINNCSTGNSEIDCLCHQTQVKCTYSEHRHCKIYQQVPATRAGVKSLPGNVSTQNRDGKRRLCKSENDMPKYSGKGLSLFVSLADDSENHLEEVFNLSEMLERFEFDVHIDHPSYLLKGQLTNLNDWREDKFKNAYKILFCISPRYFEYIQSPRKELEDSSNGLRSSVRYVYDLARSEFKDNNCQHKRFLPILFEKSGAKYPDHIPIFLKSAYIATECTEDILNRILA